jgi:hypothetical protein
MTLVQHMSVTDEHPTPPEIVEASRLVLGEIDLDPASSAECNKTVRAHDWIGRPEDGLDFEWYGRVFLNPPGGAIRKKTDPDFVWRKQYGSPSRAVVWWRKLIEEFLAGRTTSAIFIGFSIEILQSAQGSKRNPMSFPFCVPADRLCFTGNEPVWGREVKEQRDARSRDIVFSTGSTITTRTRTTWQS